MQTSFDNYLFSDILNLAIDAKNAPLISEKEATIRTLRAVAKVPQGLLNKKHLWERIGELRSEVVTLRTATWQALLVPSTPVSFNTLRA